MDRNGARTAEIGSPSQVLAKDLVVDPIQVALAAELGADAVLLSSSVLGAVLPALLDACTIAGVEAAVEVHTPNELQ